MASLAVTRLNIKKVAVLYVNTDYGVGNKDTFRQAFQDLGGEILFSDGFQQGETDFRSILAKVKKLNVEAVYILAVEENGYILKQARELGLNVRFLSTVGIEGPDLWRVAGNAGNGVIYSVQKFDPGSSTKAEQFTRKYGAAYGEEPDLFAALGYDAMYILARVIRDNGYTADRIKSGLYDLRNFDGVLGPLLFDRNGDIQGDVMMKITKDGKFIAYNP